MNKIRKDLTQEEYLVIIIDFSTAPAYQRGNLSIKGIIQHYYDEIVTQSTENTYKISVPIIESEDDLNHLTKFVLNLPQKIYEDNKDKIKGVIIIIDEFQIVKEIKDYLTSFLWIFRGHIQNHNNVAYILSASMSLNDSLIEKVAGQKGVFGGRMLTHYLYPFSQETTRKYLQEKAPQYQFTEDSFERFYKCTKGIPSYINTLANHLPQNITLTSEDIIDTFNNNLFSMIKHIINTWINLSNMEKDIIIEILEQPLQRKEIAKKLEVKSGTLSKYFKNLIQLELISNNNGIYSVKEDLLKRWLKIEYENNEVYPYRF
ncbi:MAG: ATP-binding protein [Methanosphaera sp.]|nr:ATP-binding protein [Methanosphaera sp.]